MHHCPLAGKWALSAWEGPDATPPDNALALCGPGAVDAAYSLDAQTGAWSRWFAGKPDVSNLPPLDDLQGVLALGSSTAAATSEQAPTAAQASNELQHCPPPEKWSIAVWDGASGTAADAALATCGSGAVTAAYSLDPQTGAWSRWFAGKPDLSNLRPLDDMQGVLTLGSATGPTTATPSVPTPEADKKPLPWLHVKGAQIVDESGSEAVLRGVAIEDPYVLKNFDHGLLEADFSELAHNWRASVIRVPVHPDLWEHDPGYTESHLDPIVGWGRKYGVYILLGWHAHGNPITGEVESTPWGNNYPWHGSPYDPDLDLAVAFWHEVGERYKDDSWVIYSVFDEPAYISWAAWKPIAEQLVDVVRSHNPKALVLVSGVDWAYDLRGAADDPVRANVVYEAHPYPGRLVNDGSWEEYFGLLSGSYPLFIGEWGFQPGSTDANLDSSSTDFGDPLLKYMDQEGMSWTAWCWSPSWIPTMLRNWDYDATEFGELVKDALRTYADAESASSASSASSSRSGHRADTPG
jgi:endoglucanase